MGEQDYAFLKARVSRCIQQFPSYWPKDRIGSLSPFIIQLRNPDYWLILVCTTERSETRLLFDGNWSDAIDFFSKPPESFPDPQFISFHTLQQESTLLVLARDILRAAIVNLPDDLLTGGYGTNIITDGIQVFQHPGMLGESQTLYFEHLFDEVPEKAAPRPAIFQPHSNERKAYLCRFPFVHGSEPPAVEFRTRIRRELHRDSFSIDVTIKREFISDDVSLFVFGNGFLIGESRHQSKALEAMNTFLAYCFFRGIDTAPVSVQDVGSLTIEPNGSTNEWSWCPSRPQNKRLLHKSIDIETLDEIIADFTRDFSPELALDLRLLHQSALHSAAGEHLQAFTLAWIVVERRVSSLWRANLTAKGYTDSKLKELCNSDRYTMSVMIDMLEFTSVLEKDSAQILHSMRKVRNKASHEGKIPSGEDVAKVLMLAVSYIKATAIALDFDAENLLNRIGATVESRITSKSFGSSVNIKMVLR